MAIGPVQLIVLGFNHPSFHGEIIAELERLRQSDTVRVIDALAVYKDAEGGMEVEHLSNLSTEEAVELGSKIGALVGLGIEGEAGMQAGAEAGAEAAARDGVQVFNDADTWDVLADIPQTRRQRCCSSSTTGPSHCGMPSAGPAASGSPTDSSARSTSSASAC